MGWEKGREYFREGEMRSGGAAEMAVVFLVSLCPCVSLSALSVDLQILPFNWVKADEPSFSANC